MNSVMQKFDLTGRVAIVTGGPGLLGKEFCRTLAEAGASVVIADINADGVNTLTTTSDPIRLPLPGGCHRRHSARVGPQPGR